MRLPALFSLALATLLSLAASAAHAEPQIENFVERVTSLNFFHIQSSEIAAKRAMRAETKDFAQEILAWHQDAQQDLAEAAREDGLAVPAIIDTEQREKLTALSQAPAPDFDAVYMSAQISAYAASGRLYQDLIKNGQPSRLKTFAEHTYPELHMLEVRTQAQSSPGPVTDGEASRLKR